ncbi:GspE/PulE family protein [Mucisphaera calidilacus]|uniref:Type II/IV secretion system protein n=1 Tax=Mucisphaera calidilacus TaxID=2527982 RepID=A0A518BXE5_9BACT|nr:GspE/PulE family protein [Mucisphaera calidilacus]QDU71652.1 Type II/IV secretion system protein [Mucisphaera calidilacus]
MAHRRKQIGEFLKQWGLIDDTQISEALTVSSGTRKRIGEALVDLGYVGENEVAKAIASQYDMEFVDLDQPDAITFENLELIPPDLIKKYTVLPLGKENDRIKVLVHDPMDLTVIDDLRFRLGSEIELAIGAKGKIREFIDQVMSESKASIDEAVRQMTIDASIDSSMDMSIDRGASMDIATAANAAENTDDPSAAPVVRLVNKIITEGVKSRASDIHIEPFEDRVRLRYRIDGRCHEQDLIPKRTQNAVIARLKIMSGMRVEEKRIPQDGRIKITMSGTTVDFRVSACPAYHGESVVLRILRSDAAQLGLQKLGMETDTLETFRNIIKRPNGIFLVTGPTGSGKTTSLYSALNELNTTDRKIITAEDPIEYNFKGINQCQVNESIGLTFQNILRAMLRQAPNIILVGEIRDKEVGDVAIQAALTGHMVFSTLHTNDAPSAITRLIDMGLKPFLVASSIQAILAQRLIRVLCPECKQPEENPDPQQLALVGLKRSDTEGQNLCKPVGCSACGGSGFRGRQGIYEILEMNSEIRSLAFERAPVNKLRDAATASGMRDLLGDGRLKALHGITTLGEVARFAQVEGTVSVDEEETAA